MLAAPQGFEPRFYGPEPHVLPLDEGATLCELSFGREDFQAAPHPAQAGLPPKYLHQFEQSGTVADAAEHQPRGVDELRGRQAELTRQGSYRCWDGLPAATAKSSLSMNSLKPLPPRG